MKVYLEEAKPTCVELSQSLGRQVAEITVHSDGSVELELQGDDELTTSQRQKLEQTFGLTVVARFSGPVASELLV